MSAPSRPAPWRPIPHAQPLRAWTTAQLAVVATVLERTLDAWREAWALPPSPAAVACASASEQDLAGPWQLAAAGGAGAAWIGLPPDFDDALGRALCGSNGAAGPIALGVTHACREDLLGRLWAALRIEQGQARTPEPPRACAPWCGLVHADLGAGVRLLLGAVVVESLCAGAEGTRESRAAKQDVPAIAPVAAAIAGLRLPLRARLADCELELASLQDLRIGDVVPLPHRLDALLLLCDARHEVVFNGYLARQGQHKAVELARSPGAAPQPH